MKKILMATALLLALCIVTSRKSYVGISWPKETVKRCVENTSVFFMSYPKGEFIGSGVTISKDGKVLTAAHLFNHNGAKLPQIRMLTLKGQTYEMKVLAMNSRCDLALVQPVKSAQNFPFSKLQKTNKIYVGEDVLVVGHPYEVFWTVTTGIITRISWEFWYFCVVAETDALVNPGNSGGPVFNKKGEIIGIVSAMRLTPLRQSMGLGIFIPIKEIRSFLHNYEVSQNKSIQIKRHSLGDLR